MGLRPLCRAGGGHALDLAFDDASSTIAVQAGTPGPARTTLTLSISGSSMFCSALREAFGLD